MCVFKLQFKEKLLSHTGQAKSLTPVWISMCRFKSQFKEKLLSHTEQAKSLTPVWISMCVFKFTTFLSQTVHCFFLRALGMFDNSQN